LAIAYGLAAYGAVSIPGVYTIASSVWPSAGIAQALLLLWGWRVWPGIPLGIYLFDWIHPGETFPFLALLGIPGAVLQNLAAWWLLHRFQVRSQLDRVRDVYALLGLGALLATQINCTLGALGLYLDGQLPWENYWTMRWGWWLGDAVGTVMFAPVVLLLAEYQQWWPRLRHYLGDRLRHVRSTLPLGIWFGALVGLSGVVFCRPTPAALAEYPLEYSPLLVLVWAALRFGREATVGATLLVSAIAIYGSSQGYGPFISKAADTSQAIFLLQAFLGVTVVTGLVLSAAISERNTVESSLRESEARYRHLSEQLERRVEERTHQLRQEQQQSEYLLLSILPAAIANRLKAAQYQQDDDATIIIADTFESVSVLFADIVDFTSFSAQLPPTTVVQLLNDIVSDFDRLAEHLDLEKIKTIGDAYMVVGGLPHPKADHLPAIATMALAMQRLIKRYRKPDGTPFQLRIGIHVGPVVAGTIGLRKFAYDLWGDTVNLASRMESSGEPGKIQITAAVVQELGDRYQCEYRGQVNIKGKGTLNTYWLLGAAPRSVAPSLSDQLDQAG
jgi:class 3 adenylate cyclase